eukprot:TRINITY_DN2442_c0_g1_i1.p1 TRINITY_DN2442_c0_g1~~TRINITY_DN2442_c0_g1_i1.p1  ORF type:complete len:649 (+),score=118.16 TRINITY_DN2442_c0_g1_i1:412-2358(+)
MTNGYYCNKDEEKINFVNGWFHTGDIVEITGEDGRSGVTVIDRRKHIFKLSQGFFIAPSKLEITYLKSPFIHQIAIHGDSLRSYLISIVVPNIANIEIMLRSKYPDLDFEGKDLNDIFEVRQEIILSIAKLANQSHYKSYEIPRGVILTYAEFDPDNEMISGNHKLVRRNVIKAHSQQIESMFEELDQRPVDYAEDVKNIIKDVLFENNQVFDTSNSTLQLGGSSLSVIQIAKLIKSKLNVDVPMNILYNADSVNDITNFVENTQHTPELDETWYHDTQLDPDIQFDNLTTSDFSNIFITGTTGFLGVMLLKYILEYFPDTHIYCLVRPTPDTIASDRVFSKLKEAMIDIPLELSHLIHPVEGYLEKFQFGLEDNEYYVLASNINIVYHCAAEVNSSKTYKILRGSNVVGTEEILRFCGTGSKKFLHYISTSSVQSLKTERKETRVHYSKEELSKLKGYNLSKYVAEHKIYSALDQGLDVIIYRPGMVSFSTENGFANMSDFDGRFFLGIINMQSAPVAEGKLHMIPVNWLAEAIVYISVNNTGTEIYNFNNSNNSLKTSEIISYIIEEGHAIDVVPYKIWKNQLNEIEHNNPLYPLIDYYQSKNKFPKRDGVNSTQNLQLALKHTHLEYIPEYTPDSFRLWIDYLLR